jgi:hypothetical protein
MRIKPFLVAVIAAAASVLCVPAQTDTPVRMKAFHQIKPSATGAIPVTCEVDSTQFLTAGSLNLSGNRGYHVEFDMESDTEPLRTTVGGEVISDTTKNDFIGKEIFYTYQSTPGLNFESESVPRNIYIPAGGTAAVRDFILTNKASQRMIDDTGPEYQLVVTMEVRGNLASGSPARSNPASFPIHVFRGTFPGCVFPETIGHFGPCGAPGGQDGTIPCCVSADGGVSSVPCPATK